MEIEQLVRAHIKDLKPYSSARDEFSGSEGTFLDANENPFGSIVGEGFNRYPDPYQYELKEAISEVKKVNVSSIFLGNGSDEPIDLIIRLFCNPRKDKIIITPPTYGMYEVAAEVNEVEIFRVSLSETFQLIPSNILEQATEYTKVLFLCSPNNPSANALDQNHIVQLINDFPGIVVLDEAYIDFCPQYSLIDQLDSFKNLIILQTFSKAWGMAGLRLGMAFSNPEIINYLNKIKPPYNISEVTQQLALTALENVEKKEEFVTGIRKEVEYLQNELENIEIVDKVYPSDTNFLLVKFKDVRKIFEYLIGEKVIVRDRSKLERCEGSLRITAGTRKENNRLIDVLKNYIQNT